VTEDPRVAQAETTTKVSSALTPALVLAGLSLAGGVAGIRLAPDTMKEAFVWLAVGGPILAAAQIAFFTTFDPDRLHSEKYLERKLLISKISPQLGDAGTVIDIEANSEPTPNPKALEEGDV